MTEPTSPPRSRPHPGGSAVGRLVTAVHHVTSVLVVVAFWLPWTRSGSATRSSFETLRSAQRLWLDELTPVRVIWFLIPVVILAAVPLWWSSPRTAAIVGGIVTTVVVVVAVAVLLTPVAGGVGPWLAAGAGVITSGCSLLAVVRPQAAAPR